MVGPSSSSSISGESPITRCVASSTAKPLASASSKAISTSSATSSCKIPMPQFPMLYSQPDEMLFAQLEAARWLSSCISKCPQRTDASQWPSPLDQLLAFGQQFKLPLPRSDCTTPLIVKGKQFSWLSPDLSTYASSSAAMPSISTSVSGWKKPLTSKSAIAG